MRLSQRWWHLYGKLFCTLLSLYRFVDCLLTCFIYLVVWSVYNSHGPINAKFKLYSFTNVGLQPPKLSKFAILSINLRGGGTSGGSLYLFNLITFGGQTTKLHAFTWWGHFPQISDSTWWHNHWSDVTRLVGIVCCRTPALDDKLWSLFLCHTWNYGDCERTNTVK